MIRPVNLGTPATDKVISAAAREQIANEICAASGSEVFFFGTLDEAGVLATVEAVARGTADEVPVFLERARDHNVLIHNHPGGDLTPSPADLVIASEAGARGLGFFIVTNDAGRIYRVVEPFAKKDEVELDLDEIAGIFAAGGLLSRKIPSFEDRAGQRDMAVAVAESFNRRKVAAFEGGTGIGKSYAYLVPAILWAVRNKSRVVISTQTIALGEQLIRKDLPLLARVLEEEFTYALIKGRGNYACKRKTLEVERRPEMFTENEEDGRWIGEILEHLKKGGEGSLSDLQRVPSAEVWSHFQSSTEQSLKVRCKHYNECFYYEARRRAFRAHIVVVNHHLFFADLAIRREMENFGADLVLPGYRRVVFDEAHRLEEVAADHLGSTISAWGVGQTLGRLASMREKSGLKGRLPYLAALLGKKGAPGTAALVQHELIPNVLAEREPILEAFDELRERILEFGEERGDSAAAYMVRVGDRERDLPMIVVRRLLAPIRERLHALHGQMISAGNMLRDEPFTPQEEHLAALGELAAAEHALAALIGSAGLFLAERSGMIAWAEVDRGKRKNIHLRAAPVRVDQILAESLYQPLETVLMTSATLSVDGKWDFLGERLGWKLAEEGRFHGKEFPSPFDYAEQALLVLPDDGPLPQERAFEERLTRIVVDSALAARGRTFALFTAHQMLQSVAKRAEPALREAGLPMFVQGAEPRTALLDRFRASGNGVLFGNQTFWEGVDVPGEALSCVIIAKLPFRVPTHPLELGRAEEVEARGENPFVRLSIPQAALALKQGFGRLVRTRDDRGVVIIADPRIRQKGYGAIFLRSLPGARRLEGSWAEILPGLRDYFERTRR